MLLVLLLLIFCRISVYQEFQVFLLLIVEYVLTCLLLPILNLFFLDSFNHVFLPLFFINLLLLLHLDFDQLLNDRVTLVPLLRLFLSLDLLKLHLQAV